MTVVRLPQVHDQTKFGLISGLIAIAKAKGVSAYIDGGLNRWAAGHVLDVALLYKLAIEQGVAGRKYHAAGEEGVSLKDIATAIGGRLKLPVVSISKEEAAAHFGWLAMPASTDMPASSALILKRNHLSPCANTWAKMVFPVQNKFTDQEPCHDRARN